MGGPVLSVVEIVTDQLYPVSPRLSGFIPLDQCHPLRSTAQRHGIRRHKAMLSYLHSSGMQGTYEALKRETENDDFEVDDPKAKWVGLLEKKWTSVIRLQKKVRTEGLFSAT